jgi:hypothetical protein
LKSLTCQLYNLLEKTTIGLPINIFSTQFTQFHLEIGGSLLQPNSTYQLTCQAYVNELCNKNQTVFLNTISAPNGSFDISPKSGISYLSNYSLAISNWRVNELMDLPLKYSLSLNFFDKNDAIQKIFLTEERDMIFFQKDVLKNTTLSFTNQKIELNEDNRFAFVRQPL